MSTETEVKTVTLTIDGQSVTVPKGTVVVDAAKKVDIEIPVFCYHEKLGPFGCCRMCLVEVEKMPKMMTACTLEVGEGMVVKTTTEKVDKAQKGVLEFTLLNHPLDCPVCDKGGECPLQDNTFKFGPPETRMEYDRFNRDKATPLSPVITIDRERCIACQRCTRYSDIIEKDQALVMLNRGFRNTVSTFNDRPYDTRFSGNVIDICPVGALTNTDFRFSARSWDLKNSETTCGHCACNCNMIIGTRVNEMRRVTSQQDANNAVDDGWICDKGRWGYEFTRSKNRIAEARKSGQSDAPKVFEAADEIAESLKKIVEEHGPQSVGYIGSPYALNEELYLYQKLFRQGLGTNNIDHKTHADTPGLPVKHADLLDIETAGLVLLVASDPTEELPILELRIKKAVTRLDVPLAIVNDQKTVLDRFATTRVQYNVGSDPQVLHALGQAVQGQGGSDVEGSTGVSSDQLSGLAEKIKGAGKVVVVYNPAALSSNGAAVMKGLLATLDAQDGVDCLAMPASPATNALGAMDMGVLPGFYPGGLPLSDAATIKERFGEETPLEPGLSAQEMLDRAESGQLKALVIHRCNPVINFPGGARVKAALKKLDLLVVHDMMNTETTELADYVLPSNGPGSDEGTTTNIGGRVQLRAKSLPRETPQDVRILNRMLRALGQETDYKDAAAVLKEISEKVPAYAGLARKTLRKTGKVREGIADSGGQATEPATMGATEDNLVLRVANYLFRHDKILDAESSLAHHFLASTVHMHPDDAGKLGFKEGDHANVSSNGVAVEVRVAVSGKCNPGAVVMPWVSDEQNLQSLVNPEGPTLVTVSR
ncbi:MAG: molybdopterin-dependent oxidoreductase [Candidatus Nitronauta litoralis]|uniref:Molybdopterin-dependent oxidoreductase n=1 Tax=Candidatus Nitronauta litoralis TaxID=2705533 RepID=A0A7T0FZ73_9BACT|nr:MAG: molybdopterin-dependent oxidoreductase [Candidatus Nitronauta litoralis]